MKIYLLGICDFILIILIKNISVVEKICKFAVDIQLY